MSGEMWSPEPLPPEAVSVVRAELAARAGISAPLVIALAEAIFVYSDELARWSLPRTLAVLAIAADSPVAITRRLDVDVLAGADGEGAWLIVPDPEGPGRAASISRAVGESSVASALGPVVPVGEASRSLRWARLTVALVQSGALPAQSPTRCNEHLVTVILLQDPELARALVARRLGVLEALPALERARLTETLEAWLAHQRHTPQIAKRRRRKSPSRRRRGCPRAPVGERVGQLRELAASDPEGAREQAWAWIEGLGRRARDDRQDAHDELQQLFLCGQPADDVRGQTEGRPGHLDDAPTRRQGDRDDHQRLDAVARQEVHARESAGRQHTTDSARWPAKILWPLYSTRESPLGRSAFDFKTYVEAGKLDPSVEVLVIDYENVQSNPLLLIRQIRDELVRIVPGANLGKMLVKVPARRDLFPALYFALKSEI